MDDVTSYFTDLAGTYAAHRPGYPPAAARAVLDGLTPPVRAIDVGCGTGIWSRALAAAGADVLGLDPNENMLTEARRDPGAPLAPVRYAVARAESLPLEDASVTVVTCAQAFHWFDTRAALGEFQRVLVRAGRLALIWNVRDEAEPFAAAYEGIVSRAQDDAASRGIRVHPIRSYRPDRTGHFRNVRLLVFDNPQRLDWRGLLGRVRSASYFPAAGPLKEALESELLRHFEQNEREGFVVLGQRTEVTLADPVPG